MKPLLQAEEQTDNQPQEEVEALQKQLKEQATTKPKEEQKNGGNFGSEDKIMPKIRWFCCKVSQKSIEVLV